MVGVTAKQVVKQQEKTMSVFAKANAALSKLGELTHAFSSGSSVEKKKMKASGTEAAAPKKRGRKPNNSEENSGVKKRGRKKAS